MTNDPPRHAPPSVVHTPGCANFPSGAIATMPAAPAPAVPMRTTPLQAALELLSRAADYARDAGLDPWEFAVELAELRSLGVTLTDLRWLLARGYAAQAIETTLPDSAGRTFRPPPRSGFPAGSCFVLSPAAAWRSESRDADATSGAAPGAPWSRWPSSSPPQPSAPQPSAPQPSAPKPPAPKPSAPQPCAPQPCAPQPPAPKPSAPSSSAPSSSASRPAAHRVPLQPLTVTESLPAPDVTSPAAHPAASASADPRSEPTDRPHWDAHRRELTFRGQVVKRFRVNSPNQELILAAFEEEAWPDFIDDPLPPVDDIDPHVRLQATIKSLNRHQQTKLIRFRGNGGETVFWEGMDDKGR